MKRRLSDTWRLVGMLCIIGIFVLSVVLFVTGHVVEALVGGVVALAIAEVAASLGDWS